MRIVAPLLRNTIFLKHLLALLGPFYHFLTFWCVHFLEFFTLFLQAKKSPVMFHVAATDLSLLTPSAGTAGCCCWSWQYIYKKKKMAWLLNQSCNFVVFLDFKTFQTIYKHSFFNEKRQKLWAFDNYVLCDRQTDTQGDIRPDYLTDTARGRVSENLNIFVGFCVMHDASFAA